MINTVDGYTIIEEIKSSIKKMTDLEKYKTLIAKEFLFNNNILYMVIDTPLIKYLIIKTYHS